MAVVYFYSDDRIRNLPTQLFWGSTADLKIISTFFRRKYGGPISNTV